MKIKDNTLEAKTPDVKGTEKPNALKELPQRDRWEYRQFSITVGSSLDKLGQEGWELVSVVPKPADPGMLVAFFKRRIL